MRFSPNRQHEEADTKRYLEEHPEVPLPTREWVLSWLKVNLFEREPEDVLANLVGRCVIDSEEKFSLTIPWLPQSAKNVQKTGERPGREQFAGVKVGSLLNTGVEISVSSTLIAISGRIERASHKRH